MHFVEPIRDRKKLEVMKAVLKSKSLRNYAIFVLGINSGLRVSDLLNLKVRTSSTGSMLKTGLRYTSKRRRSTRAFRCRTM